MNPKRFDRQREKHCTSKRAFHTREYAEMFRRYLGADEMQSYKCKFCGEFHLGHARKFAHEIHERNEII